VDIDKVGGWLNLTANVAVLIGIVFLAIEVRHAGNSAEMQMQDSLANGFNDLALALAADPLLARLYVLGLNDPDHLTDVEAIQFGMFFRAYLNQQFRVFQLYQMGVMSEDDWILSAEELGTMLATPGGRQYMQGNDDMSPELESALKPYLGGKPKWDLMMGRDATGLE
jgi:hypothetical protein